MKQTCLLSILLFINSILSSQPISKVWVPDNGDGTYKNPVLHADYSDPDVIRVGTDFYLVASSFEAVPGLPVLHSKDLVNWSLIGHALPRQPPFEHFSTPRHGEGVWAPSLRYHKGEFYLYYPDPDFGIYLTKATNPAGPWSTPLLVAAGKGLIDPCPLWDDDGKAYLVHAFAGSRAGIKSILVIKPMTPDGTALLGDGTLVYDGHLADPTIEGPKLYKRDGWYYIFAPAGGVATGWQVVLRSATIYGPYDRKVVMAQGASATNGPHQGAWVTTTTGQDWFLHFQDKGAYGRVVHLQPMAWKDGWPVIGVDADGDGVGEPVLTAKKPAVGRTYSVKTPAESDEFSGANLGRQWQWMANPKSTWAFVYKDSLRLFSDKLPDSAANLWQAPNVLLQKFPAEEFMATTQLTFRPNPAIENERCGLVVMGTSYAGLAVVNKKDGLYLVHTVCADADKGSREKETQLTKLASPHIYLRVTVQRGGKCGFSYSTDGKVYLPAGELFTAQPGRWTGAKVGLFCTRPSVTNDAGLASYNWFRIEPLR